MSWPIVKLDEICLVRRGTTITEKNSKAGSVPVVAGGVSYSYQHNISNRSANVITVSASGANAGFVNFWDIPIFASDCSTVEPLNNNIDIRFIFYFLKSKQDFINQTMRSGAAQPHVYAKDIAQIRLPFPPLAEQQRIAAILDKAEEIKRKRELVIKKLEILNKEIFADMFGNLLEKPNTTLGSSFDVRDGTHDSPKSQAEGYALVTSKNLSNNTINFENVSFINLEDFEAINKRSKVDYCDVLMPMIGTIGNPIIVQDKNPQFAIKNVALIKTGNLDASYYIKALLETEYFERYVAKESKGGTQKFLSLGNIRSFPIYLPSDEHLHKFSKIFNALIQVQNSIDNSRFKLSKLLSSLQDSLMVNN